MEAIVKKYTFLKEAQSLFSQQLEGNQGNSKVYPKPNAVKSSTMEQRRKLELCFKYGDKFSPDYQCLRLLLHMEGIDEEKEENNEGVVLQEETGECRVTTSKTLQKLL